MEAADHSVSVKRTFIDWVRLAKSEERYYFSKAMDLFYQLPLGHQREFIRFVAEKEAESGVGAKWLEKIDDNTQYPDVIRSILFYYTGRKDLDQPFRQQIAIYIGEFVKSSAFKDASESEEVGSFVEELDAI